MDTLPYLATDLHDIKLLFDLCNDLFSRDIRLLDELRLLTESQPKSSEVPSGII